MLAEYLRYYLEFWHVLALFACAGWVSHAVQVALKKQVDGLEKQVGEIENATERVRKSVSAYNAPRKTEDPAEYPFAETYPYVSAEGYNALRSIVSDHGKMEAILEAGNRVIETKRVLEEHFRKNPDDNFGTHSGRARLIDHLAMYTKYLDTLGLTHDLSGGYEDAYWKQLREFVARPGTVNRLPMLPHRAHHAVLVRAK